MNVAVSELLQRRAEHWLDRWRAWRNRILAARGFQDWACAFLPTRPLARRRALALFDLCAGFVYSQVLMACVELRLFERLRARACRLEELALDTPISQDCLRVLLVAAASLDLVHWDAARRLCSLGPLGAALLAHPGLQKMIAHQRLLYVDLAEPLAVLRGAGRTHLQEFWAYARPAGAGALAEESVREYSALMSASQEWIASEVFRVCPLAAHRCLLDIGAGEGAFAERAALLAPDLRVLCFDLPPVAARAARRLQHLGPRARAIGGDFRRDPLPAGADLITLVRVLHDHDTDTVRHLLHAACAALAPGGTLLIAEPMAGERAGRRVADAYFAFYLRALGQGEPRSAAQLGNLMREAGLRSVRSPRMRLPMNVRVLLARKPA